MQDAAANDAQKARELEARVKELTETVEDLKSQIAWFRRNMYGRKSEKLPEDVEEQELLKLEDAMIKKAACSAPEKKAKGGSRKGRQTRAARLPADLPVKEETIVPLPVQEAPEKWRRIAEEVTERLEMEPGKLFLVRTIRPTFVSIETPSARPVTAPAPPALVEGQFFGASLLAELCLDKFLSHLPLYRQSQAFLWKYGVDLPMSTLCNAIGSCARQVNIVVRHMSQEMWAGGYVQMDLTPISFLGQKTKSGAAATGQMWVATVPGGDVVYHWRLTKEAAEAESIIPENFQGILQCDGGSELACWLKGGKKRRRRPAEKVRRAGCMAHVRRKFEHAWQNSEQKCQTSYEFLLLIGALYKVEADARATGLTGEDFYAKRRAMRQKSSLASMTRLKTRLDAELRQHRPKSPLGKAIAYALSQWPSLQIYLEDGRCEIDNNPVENAIRPSAIGKKNYLFMGSSDSGHWAATFYSLIGSCLRHKVNPRDYLHWLFTKLPTVTAPNAGQFTPAAFAALKTQGAPVAAVA